MKQELLTKARRYQGKGFLSENYRGYYWKYCNEEDISPSQFEALVKGTNTLSFTPPIEPSISMEQWWNLYESKILEKPEWLNK